MEGSKSQWWDGGIVEYWKDVENRWGGVEKLACPLLAFCGMSHVRTSPYYPQSNGKLERMHGTLKQECIRPKCPGSLEEAREIVAEYVKYYNTKRLHSAIGYVTPQDMLEGRQAEIHQARDRKLELARQRRKEKRQSKYRRAS